MVSIKKRTKPNGSIFYYLEHSVRIGSRVGKRLIYLGKKIPRNIDELKTELFRAGYTNTTMMTLKLSKEIMLKKLKSY